MIKQKIKIMSDILLFISFIFLAISGFFLNFFPKGPRSGQVVLFDLTKQQWQDLHTIFAYLLILFTILHLIFYWKIFLTNIKSLIKGN